MVPSNIPHCSQVVISSNHSLPAIEPSFHTALRSLFMDQQRRALQLSTRDCKSQLSVFE
ncbi:hypothetical protein Mapa_010375 [Marchantia paleacea]|nr:hypothetical protein Mapa_010375 [Marchantia paleacea]